MKTVSRNPDLLTTKEAAAYLGMSDWSIRKSMRQPVDPIPSRFINGRRWFLKSEIWPWFERQPLDTGTAAPPKPVDIASRKSA